MLINDFLIKAQECLDDAIVEDGIGNRAGSMYYLGKLHGLLIKYIETPKPDKCESNESSKGK